MDQNPGNSPGGSGTTDTASLVKEQVQNQAQQVAQQAQQTAGQVADQAKQQTTTALASQKNKAADTLDSVAEALRQTSQQLEQQQGGISQLGNKAADRVESVSGYLRNRDVNEIVYEAESYARNNPGIFLGGALALGFLAARFLKSSPVNSGGGRYTSSTGYDRTNYGAGASSSGGYASTGMPDGEFNYANVPHRYEDVSGIPPVQHAYTGGTASGMTAPETMSDDMGTGLMADHPNTGGDYGS